MLVTADAKIILHGNNMVNGLPAGCTKTHDYGLSEDIVTCSLAGLEQGTHPLFTDPGVTGTMDAISPHPIFIEASMDVPYEGGSVSGSDAKTLGVSGNVPGDSIQLILTALTSPIIAGGTILYDVWYDLNSALLIDHSYVTYNLDPAVTVTSVGVNCVIAGPNSVQCGSGMGGIRGGTTGWLSGIGFGGISGIIDPLVQPGYQLVSTVTFSGVYDGGWGHLNADNTTVTPLGDAVPVPEFPGPAFVVATLAGLSLLILWVRKRG